MPSEIPTVQVRYSDHRIGKILDAFVRTGKATSRSKLVEQLSTEPILQAFRAWLVQRVQDGATYSELFEDTGIVVPELMALVEPEISLAASDISRHLKAVSASSGIDVERIWTDTQVSDIGPL